MHTKEEFIMYAQEAFFSSIDELIGIWNYVGYDEDERKKRWVAIANKMKQTLIESIKVENAGRLEMEKDVENLRRKTAELCHELELPAFFPDRHLTTCSLIEVLTQKCEELEQQKTQRQIDYDQLLKSVKSYKELLCISDEDFAQRLNEIQSYQQDSSKLPSVRVIDNLRKWDLKLTEEYKPQLDEYESLCDVITRIAIEIEYQAANDLEANILRKHGMKSVTISKPATPGVVRKNLAKQSYDSDQINNAIRRASNDVMSNGDAKDNAPGEDDDISNRPRINAEILESLRTWRLKVVKEKAKLMGAIDEMKVHLEGIWERLDVPENQQKIVFNTLTGYNQSSLEVLQDESNRCEQIKWENLPKYLNRLKSEMNNLAMICCMDQDDLRRSMDFDPDDDEAMASYLENKVDKLKMIYNNDKEIFDMFRDYHQLWAELYEIEKRMRDPAILSNRGGILLKTEKEKKRVMKDLRQMEASLKISVKEYEENNEGKEFVLSNGMTFSEYVRRKNEAYEAFKESSRGGRRSTASSQKNGPPGAPT